MKNLPDRTPDPKPTDPRAAPLSRRTLIDRYRLGERLGRGELGDVYAADDLLRLSIASEAPVAVKVIHPTVLTAQGGLRKVAPHLAAACHLSHPHLTNAYDFYQDGDLVFLAMERLEGTTLATRLANTTTSKPLSFAEADTLLRQLVDALGYLHATAPAIRLHPGRLWIRDDGSGICLADLALSPLLDLPTSRQSAIASSNSVFIAPEWLDGGAPPTTRADQYALGILALNLFTGSTSASDHDLKTALDRASNPWATAVPKLLDPDPEHRFDDIAELASHLTAEKPVSRRFIRRPPAAGHTAEDQTRRSNRRRLGWAAAIAAASLVTAVWTFGPDTIADSRATTEASAQLDEAHRQLHALTELRNDLLATGLHRDGFTRRIQILTGTRNELDIATTLGAAAQRLRHGETVPASIDIASAAAALAARRDAFLTAAAAITAFDDLTTVRDTAAALAPNTPAIPSDATPGTLNQELATTLRHFDSGDFNTATTTANGAATRARQSFATTVASLAASADSSRETWHAALADFGDLPVVEPIGAPAARIARATTAAAEADWATAAAEFAAASNRYTTWSRELDQKPHPPADGSTTPSPFTNSLAMQFLPVGDLMASRFETRLIDFLAFVTATGADAAYKWREFAVSSNQGPLHPAACINLADAVRFCQWLTSREHQSGLIPPHQAYRLPTDLEWSQLAGLGDDPAIAPFDRSFAHLDHFPWPTAQRTSTSGNYDTWPNRERHSHLIQTQDPFPHTSPAGHFPPNSNGVYDLGGNVWEWTTSPLFATPQTQARVIRGGGWRTLDRESMRTAFRAAIRPANEEVGFRIVLAPPQTNANDGASPNAR